LRTDTGLLRRVLDNLLDNSVSYADAGSVITASAMPVGRQLRLTVENACRDAHPEQARRAVEPFWQGDPGRGQTGRHAGLGLALCKRIAEALGGKLEVEAGGGRFAVSVTLPADSAPSDADD
jgi:two-component system heavy metal sensor histidine kinase CusS